MPKLDSDVKQELIVIFLPDLLDLGVAFILPGDELARVVFQYRGWGLGIFEGILFQRRG